MKWQFIQQHEHLQQHGQQLQLLPFQQQLQLLVLQLLQQHACNRL